MANAVDLKKNPIFIAHELECYDEGPTSKYKMAVGKELAADACSYYTVITIIKGEPDQIQLETLREALSEALKKLDSQGK